MGQRQWVAAAVGCLVMSAGIAACKRSTPTPPAPPNPTGMVTPRTPAGPEYVKAAQDLEAAFMAGDIAAMDRVMDSEALANTATAGVDASKAAHDGFVGGFRAHGLSEVFSGLRRSDATYHLLKVFTQEGKTRAIFRLVAGGGLNYHDWTLERRADGTVRAVDAYIAMSGEYLSQTFHRLYVKQVAAQDSGLMGKLMGTDRAIIDHSADLDRMAADSQSGNFTDLLDIYDKLPESLRNEKSIFIYRIMACQKLSDAHPDLYAKAIADYEKTFPGDPSLDLLSLDGALLAKDYSAFYKSAARLEHWTGGDPYLEGMEANVLMMEDKPGAAEKAEEESRHAVESESGLIMPRVILVKSLAGQKKYAEAVKELKVCEQEAGEPIAADAIREMDGLAQSPEYQAYRGGAGK